MVTSTDPAVKHLTRKEAALVEGTKNSRDQTFLKYTDEQAKAYAAGRGVSSSYPQELYDIIIQHHVETGGKLGLLMDVGCGPGNSTRDIAQRFTRVIGTDGSAGMINEAIKLGGQAKDQPIEWAVTEAEEIADKMKDVQGQVDLMTVAMAAHWFDMTKFWQSASKLLTPGGTVAIWTCSSAYASPSMPKAKEVQAVLGKLEDEILGPYASPGNWMSRNLYQNMILPWTSSPPVPEFSEASYVRKEWNKDGKCEPGKTFFMGETEYDLKGYHRGFKTASMYTRWYAANKEDVEAGRKRDCIDEIAEELRAILPPGEKMKIGSAGVLLLVKKE